MAVAILTGASSGIGEAMARELHRRGWKVGLIARREELIASLAASLGEGAACAAADVTDAPGLAGAIAALEAKLGPCDLLIANAGIGAMNRAKKFDRARAESVLRVNIEGVLNAVAAVMPGMIARGSGQLVAVSSVAGYRGMPAHAPYNASKAAVTVLMESWRIELAPLGIAVTTVHPGFIDTPMTQVNRFPMPFLMPADRFARAAVSGVLRRKAEVNLPWQMAWLMAVVRLLPNWFYDRAMRRLAPR